ncbi:hypothetical protein BC827DRAFT_1087468, partial [Russula dissimulans]
GSFHYDRESGKYPMEWLSLADFEEWHRNEERIYLIELIGSTVVPGRLLWTQKCLYVCSHQLSGGRNKYKNIYPNWKHKIETKKTGCCCHVIIKLYPHMPLILGRYTGEHDHKIGIANIKFTQLSRGAHEQIKLMLAQK